MELSYLYNLLVELTVLSVELSYLSSCLACWTGTVLHVELSYLYNLLVELIALPVKLPYPLEQL